MAIGDSLYNGVQSLRINWWLSEWSAPSLVAIRLGLIEESAADRTGAREFYGPQYPGQGGSPGEVKNYGFNLEKPGISGLRDRARNIWDVPKEQRESLRDLLDNYSPPNGRAMVDNIAFSGANSLDLVYWTAGEHRSLAHTALTRMKGRFPSAFSALGDAYTYANAAFVLNPTRDRCLDQMTPLEQVQLRRPKRLLVNIGSNNGLYKVAFLGRAIGEKDSCPAAELEKGVREMAHCVQPIKSFLNERLPADMKTLMNGLQGVKNLEYVYINNLALPSQVANVLFGSRKNANTPRFPIHILNNKQVPRQFIDDGDKLVTGVNAGLRREIETQNSKSSGPRFVYVDLAEKLRSFDYKKCVFRQEGDCDDRKLVVSKSTSETDRDYSFDNRPLRASGSSGYVSGSAFAARISQGGLFSFDNMHLSSLGYEIMAFAVREAMQGAEDPILAPLPRAQDSRCRKRSDPDAHIMQPGDCIGQLSLPGWSIADATRRDFIFQRIAGDDEMRNREFIRALLAFMQ